MKIFVLENIIGNYCSGDWYFIAETKDKALYDADIFAAEHNENVKNNPNYIIEWNIDGENIKEFNIKPGFIPLNRVEIYAVKY
jgi:hypothetical protein